MQQDLDHRNSIGREKKHSVSRFSANIQQIYMHHPIANLSWLTGWRYPGIPRLLGNPITGRLSNFFTGEGVLKNLIEAGKLAASHPTGMCYYWLAHQPVLLITQPEHIKELFITKEQNVSRRTATKFMEAFWGSSITTDHYDLWKKKRAVYANHLTTPNILAEYEPQMQTIANKYLENIQKSQHTSVNLRNLLSNYTLEMVLSLMLPFDAQRNIKQYAEYTEFVGDQAANLKNVFKATLPIWLQKLFFRDKSLRPAYVKAKMKNTFNELLLSPYSAHIKNTHNFIRSMWELRKTEPGQELLEQNTDVFGDSNALFFAAQDTVTTTFEFTIKLLCANPAIENKLRSQLRLHLQGKEFTMENINKVDYLEMVIKEVLRLYPPAPMLPRGVDTPFKIDNIPLFKRNLIIVSPYLTHRLKNLWENPEEFDPERFSKENISKIIAHAYIPFGDGRHGCVGWRFAFQQLKLLLAAIYMHYHVDIEENGFEITIHRTTIKPKITTVARFVPIE